MLRSGRQMILVRRTVDIVKSVMDGHLLGRPSGRPLEAMSVMQPSDAHEVGQPSSGTVAERVTQYQYNGGNGRSSRKSGHSQRVRAWRQGGRCILPRQPCCIAGQLSGATADRRV